MSLAEVVNLESHPITDEEFCFTCKQTLDRDGVLVLQNFIHPDALSEILAESVASKDSAYFCVQEHSVYLTGEDSSFPPSHPVNRKVTSSKGCICDDVVGQDSKLRQLYNNREFRQFVRKTTGESELHSYADPLSSINIHYANYGQELGWHFDNSEFAITLLIQKPEAGSKFEYVKDFRDSDAGDMNYEGVQALLDGKHIPDVLSMNAGALVLFRGRNSIHRVSPNLGQSTRILAVLAYNSKMGIELSESARMTFYGRLS